MPRNKSAIKSSQTILGAKTHFIGTLRSHGDVRIEDIFEGDITAKGRVVLGSQATLDGNLTCTTAIIAGIVRGKITAEAVKITSTGKSLGGIRAVKVLTEEGAGLQGELFLEEVFTPITFDDTPDVDDGDTSEEKEEAAA